MTDVDDRVGALHGQDVADRRGIGVGGPFLQVRVELADSPDHADTAVFEQLVEGELAVAVAEAISWLAKSRLTLARSSCGRPSGRAG